MLSLRTLANRYQALSAELRMLDAGLHRLTATAALELVALFGVGADSAEALLVAAGDNPRSAALGRRVRDAVRCLADPSLLRQDPPAPAQSRGDRQANAALHRIVVARLGHDQPAKDYLVRRIHEGRSKKEAIRCLTRYVDREVFDVLPR